MPAKITIETDHRQMLDALARLAKGVERPAPALKAISELLVESTKQRFAASSAPDGSRWLPNAQATFEAYLGKPETRGKNFRQDGRLSARGATRAANKKPLVDSGLLTDGILWQMDGNAALEVGTNRFAGAWEGGAAVHHFGSRDGHIPARPFLGVSDQDAQGIEDIVLSLRRSYDDYVGRRN